MKQSDSVDELITPHNVDYILQLRSMYFSSPNSSHLRRNLKRIMCHVLLKIQREFLRKWFHKLSHTRSDLESNKHIGFITQLNEFNGLIKCGNEEYHFSRDNIVNPYCNFFATAEMPVIFWIYQNRVQNISPLFDEKYQKISKIPLRGFISDDLKYINFTLFNLAHSIRLSHCSFQRRSLVTFILRNSFNRVYATKIKQINVHY
tara:strand:+ start:462 stop:1073 length:612 start_codon:yes stop_codon:yes gene_type:complete